MRASVVVPVYNPGESLDRCIDSLLNQSLPTAMTDLIFVDDGSTDGSGDRLDNLARQHAHVRVIHEPNSGWAGRPRNVGLGVAHGEFVQFVDQDDALGAEALERLTDFGATHDADIVIGKVTSDFRRVPHELFRRNIPRCSVHDVPLMRSLTPHKMFRRSFLMNNGLRFAEGRRRLEDQLFMTQAYFATDAVAILADYPCYYYLRRDDELNAAKSYFEPAAYYGFVREVLDVVAVNTEPGPFRDAVHARFLNAMLHKVSMLTTSDSAERLAAFMTEIRAVTGEYFSPSVVTTAPVLRRELAKAILSGKPKRVETAVRRYEQVGVGVKRFRLTPSGAGGWTASVRGVLEYRDGTPLLFHRRRDGWRVDKRLRTQRFTGDADSREALLEATSGDLVVRSLHNDVAWVGATSLTARLVPSKTAHRAFVMRLAGQVELNPTTFAAGGPLPRGTWQVALRIRALGTTHSLALLGPTGLRLPRRVDRARNGARLQMRRGGRLVLVVDGKEGPASSARGAGVRS